MRVACFALVIGLFASLAHAQDDPLVAIADGDPIELARAVDRLGDEAVLERLSSRSRSVRLAAIRAAPHLRWPERALMSLAGLAGGRDPDLAPAAAESARSIAEELTSDQLARREVDPASLGEAAAALRAVAADRTARADIRAVCARAAAALDRLGS
jgi:hypothetical protein